MRVENFEQNEYTKRNVYLREKGITYKEYLQSEKWKQARMRLFKRDGKICKICGSDKYINVHHNNYNRKNLGGSIRSLVVLCNSCHNEVHRIAKVNGWYYKKIVRSLKKRHKKYGSIQFYPKNSSVRNLAM